MSRFFGNRNEGGEVVSEECSEKDFENRELDLSLPWSNIPDAYSSLYAIIIYRDLIITI